MASLAVAAAWRRQRAAAAAAGGLGGPHTALGAAARSVLASLTSSSSGGSGPSAAGLRAASSGGRRVVGGRVGLPEPLWAPLAGGRASASMANIEAVVYRAAGSQLGAARWATTLPAAHAHTNARGPSDAHQDMAALSAAAAEGMEGAEAEADELLLSTAADADAAAEAAATAAADTAATDANGAPVRVLKKRGPKKKVKPPRPPLPVHESETALALLDAIDMFIHGLRRDRVLSRIYNLGMVKVNEFSQDQCMKFQSTVARLSREQISIMQPYFRFLLCGEKPVIEPQRVFPAVTEHDIDGIIALRKALATNLPGVVDVTGDDESEAILRARANNLLGMISMSLYHTSYRRLMTAVHRLSRHVSSDPKSRVDGYRAIQDQLMPHLRWWLPHLFVFVRDRSALQEFPYGMTDAFKPKLRILPFVAQPGLWERAPSRMGIDNPSEGSPLAALVPATPPAEEPPELSTEELVKAVMMFLLKAAPNGKAVADALDAKAGRTPDAPVALQPPLRRAASWPINPSQALEQMRVEMSQRLTREDLTILRDAIATVENRTTNVTHFCDPAVMDFLKLASRVFGKHSFVLYPQFRRLLVRWNSKEFDKTLLLCEQSPAKGTEEAVREVLDAPSWQPTFQSVDEVADWIVKVTSAGQCYRMYTAIRYFHYPPAPRRPQSEPMLRAKALLRCLDWLGPVGVLVDGPLSLWWNKLTPEALESAWSRASVGDRRCVEEMQKALDDRHLLEVIKYGCKVAGVDDAEPAAEGEEDDTDSELERAAAVSTTPAISMTGPWHNAFTATGEIPKSSTTASSSSSSDDEGASRTSSTSSSSGAEDGESEEESSERYLSDLARRGKPRPSIATPIRLKVDFQAPENAWRVLFDDRSAKLPAQSELMLQAKESSKIMVTNLPPNVTESDIAMAFERCGPVKAVQLMTERFWRAEHQKQLEQGRVTGTIRTPTRHANADALGAPEPVPLNAFVLFEDQFSAEKATSPSMKLFGITINMTACNTIPARDSRVLYIGNWQTVMSPTAVSSIVSKIMSDSGVWYEGQQIRIADADRMGSYIVSNGDVFLSCNSHSEACVLASTLRGVEVDYNFPLVVSWASPEEWARARPAVMPRFF